MQKNNSKLSICIPTFNRLRCLKSCLDSILVAKKYYNFDFEVCISDNNPKGNAKSIVHKYNKDFAINYQCNSSNIGLGKNICESVLMASGEFVWILGNDDMLLPHTFEKLQELLNKPNIDYFYINSINLNSNLVNLDSGPVDTNQLPLGLENFSKSTQNFQGKFFELVDQNISFDFMLGMFLSIFKREKWFDSKSVLNDIKLSDTNLYSSFDNTCPHIMIFANAFHNSQIWFQAKPLSINMIGEREWGDLYPFIAAIRIPEVLDEYYKYGLPLFQYLKCKNFALRRFIPYLILMIFSKKYKGLKYIGFKKNIIYSLFFPYVYIYPFYDLFRKIKNTLK